MKLILKGKTYYVNKYTPAMVMEASRLLEKATAMTLSEEAELIDELVPFITSTVFKDQFTANDFLNHYESPNIVADLLGVLGAVRGVVVAELANFPMEEEVKNAQRGKGKA